MGVDRITSGPLTAAGTNPYDQQALVLDAQNNILETSGSSRALAAARSAQAVIGAQTALATVTTAQNLISRNLNAGVLNKLGRTFIIKGWLIYTTPGTTTPTLTIALTLGGVTLISIVTAGLSATASTNMPTYFEFTFQTVSTGPTGTIEAHGQVNANISANTPAAALAQYVDNNIAVSSAVNLNSALALAVTVAGSSAITSIQLRQATIEVVN
jgi:hypothetical protein